MEPEPQAQDSTQPPTASNRTGKTLEHYNRQNSQAFSYFRIRSEDVAKMEQAQFTIYDFITNSFSFSTTKKDLTVRVLEALKEGPLPFAQLHRKLGAKKSTLYLLILALQRSGLVAPSGKNEPLTLSPQFAQTLQKYAEWWERWLKH